MSVAINYPMNRDELARTTPAASYTLRVEIGGAAETVPFPASGTLTAGRWYWVQGDRLTDLDAGIGGVGDWLATLETAINGHTSSAVVSVIRGTDGRLTLSCATSMRVLWGNALTTLDSRIFGFTQADPSAATSHLAPALPRGLWAPPGVWPISTSRPIARRRVGVAESLSGRVRVATWAESRGGLKLQFGRIQRAWALDEYAASTAPYATLEQVWSALSRGRPIRYLEDVTAPNTYRTWRARTAMEGRDSMIQRDGVAPHLLWATPDIDLIEVT